MKAQLRNSATSVGVALTVDDLTAAAQSASTKKTYASAVRHFLQNGGAIPCSDKTLAEYLAALSSTHKVASLELRVIAIHNAHTSTGFASPAMSLLVKRTMAGIRRTLGTAQRRVKALVKDDLLEALVLSDTQMPVKAARDKALLLIGFAGAFRRSELVALKVENLTENEAGIDVLLVRSKTDKFSAGRTVFLPYAKGERCPIKALKAWQELAGIESGFLFRAVSRYDRVSSRALTPQSVALIVKSAVRRAHGDAAAAASSGQSLRSGYCTQAALSGLASWQIKETTGHRSDATLAKYIRPVQRRKIPSLL
jgi:site-specific recombinase XerD